MTASFRDAFAHLVFAADTDAEHLFEHSHDGDGWNEPFCDTYSCWCGKWSVDWTQHDPDQTGRPDPAEMLLAWHAHAEAAFGTDAPTEPVSPKAPDVIVLRPDPGRPSTTVTLTDSVAKHDAGAALVAHVFHAIRDTSSCPVPTGVLYTANGAHDMADLLATIWSSPEADALRALPPGGQRYRDPYLATQERADKAFRRLWAGWRAER